MSKTRKKTVTARRAPVMDRQNGACHYCGIAMTIHKGVGKQIPRNFATWDHKIPRAADGGDDVENLVLACVECNDRKGSLPYETFMAVRGWDMPAKSFQLLKMQMSAARQNNAGFFYHMVRLCPSCDIVMTLPRRKGDA